MHPTHQLFLALQFYLFIIIIIIIIIIYLTANGLTPGGSSTATLTHKQYTEYKEQNIHSNTKKKNVKCEVRAVPRLCELYPGICLTTEGKARKNLSYGTIQEQLHNIQEQRIPLQVSKPCVK